MYLTFINGVLNKENQARESLQQLQAFTLKNHIIDNVDIRWKPKHAGLFYNYTQGILDILEAYEQKEGEITDNFWDWMFDLSKAPKWFLEAYRDTAKKELQRLRTPGLAENLGRMLLNLDTLVMDLNLKVLIVSHSQGNFFANSMYEERELSPSDQTEIRIVSVATPSGELATGGSYTTLDSDFVIRSLPDTLPANVKNDSPSPGMFDHAFVKYYLRGDGASAHIAANMKAAAQALAKIGRRSGKASCWKWFQREMPLGTSPEACPSVCAALPIGMGNFDCTLQCNSLCKCRK
ncbi:MAG TPA: hypothetical protein VM901_05430 [Bdellovibrionota bacterium]|jgi:hypothetical protein|nr:hypothetical protein [Bdellovibrionota bacterium]